MDVSPDVNVIYDFLENISARDYFHLAKIEPRKNGRCVPFIAYDIEEAVDWIVSSNEHGWNIYDQWNPPSKKFGRRAKREDIRWLMGFHLDLDLPDNVERSKWFKKNLDPLYEFGRPHIIMSGNGYQVRWPFAQPLRATDDNIRLVETYNKKILTYFKAGKGTWNVDRLLRVPGTINYPDELKRKRGFRIRLAEIKEVTTETFTAHDFSELRNLAIDDRTQAKGARIDYSKRDYTPDYIPVTYSQLLHLAPFIIEEIEEIHNNTGRSEAGWVFAKKVAIAFSDHFNCELEDLFEDKDIYKNIFELALDSDMDFLGHYEEKGWGKLGFDISRAVAQAIDDAKQYGTTSVREKKKRNEKRILHAAASHDETTDPMQHRLVFLAHVKNCIDHDHLPNVRTDARGNATTEQDPTESNIRAIFEAGGIEAGWDAMRDKPVYDVGRSAGHVAHDADKREAKKARLAPHNAFHGALRKVSADMTNAAQESLLADALHGNGIRNRMAIPKVCEIVAKERRFHPIQAYATEREWDGLDHIAEVADCIDSNHPLKEHYIRLFFRQCIAAVKSLQHYLAGHGEGLQLSAVVILEGAQYIGKSTFWTKITPPGFLAAAQAGLRLGTHKEEDSKRECLSGLVAVLNEIMASFDRSQRDALKNFVSATYDEFRTAYAHWPTCKPRMTVFTGTANELVLKDPTGSRRWLIMNVERFDFEHLAEIDLQQCYAQAWHEVMVEGKQWWLTEEEDAIRAEYNERYQEISEEESAIESYLGCVTERHKYKWMTVYQIFDLLNIRNKHASKIRVAHDHMLTLNLDYAAVLDRKGKNSLKKVFRFPVTNERFMQLTDI